MSRTTMFAVALATVLVMLACATAVTVASLPPEQRDAIQVRHFAGPDSVIFSAVLGMLVDKGYPVMLSDRSTGTIQSGSLVRTPNSGQDFATGFFGGVVMRYRQRVAARIKGGDTRLVVSWDHMTRRESFIAPEGAWEPYDPSVEDARLAYDSLFADIRHRLE